MQDKEYTAYSAGGGDFRSGAIADRRRISWGAIFAGTVAALSVQLLLTLLGLSIGMWAVSPTDPGGFQGLGIGAAIWGIVSFIIALYCGGWIAGRMSGLGSKFDGFLEGFVVWGVVTVVTFMLLTTAIGGIIGGAAGIAGEVLAVAGEQVEEPMEILEQYGAPVREEMEDPETQEEFERAAREAGEDVAQAGAAASFWAFLALLLGAIAAAFAGRQGSASSIREAVPETGHPKTK